LIQKCPVRARLILPRRQEPSPRYASSDSKFLGLLDQDLLPADFIWSRNEKVGQIHLAHDPRKSFDQQITTLRGVNPAEENYQLFAL
jgi:hypothetical protein